MSRRYDDDKITADFQQLRDAEREYTPGFSSLVNANQPKQTRFGLLYPAAGLAVVILTLSIFTAILYPQSNDTPPTSADYVLLSSVKQMPTDFLLETPWSQLASLEPASPLFGLDDELLEDLPDEL